MKRILAIAVVLLTLCSLCFTVVAEEAHLSQYGETFKAYTVDGAVSGVTAQVRVLEFSPNGENPLVPFAYSGNVGSVAVAQDQVAAAIAEGYEVVGAINGSFFEMSSGAPCGTLITNGKLMFTHVDRGEPMATFDSDGRMTVVNSKMSFKFNLNGQSYDGAIGLVNKVYKATGMVGNKNIKGHFQYYDIDAGDIADEKVTGVEIICQITSGGYLSMEKTLSATVTEVKKESYYGATKVTDDKHFVLFVATDGLYFKRASVMKSGDTIDITPTEFNEYAKEAMKNAVSAIGAAYWLVQDGVDKTDTATTIVHDTSLARAWTAFGVKEDGSYVYFVNEEYGLTLKDVADEMIRLGCKDVIRLDGGGSTSMFVKGEDFVMSSSREVCDVLLVVRKDSIKDNTPVTEPDESSATAETTEPEETTQPEESAETDASESSVVEESSEENEDSSDNKWLIWVIVGAAVCICGAIVFSIKTQKK